MPSSKSLIYMLSIAACTTNCAAASEKGRPRGVGPDFAKFYRDLSTFSCISNPSIQIPFSAVNDDYCDCPDGSDEPGTSACSHLSPASPAFISDPGEPDANRKPALPGFYCKNKGHNPSYIPFQRINDGVCDYEFCCDGSDEWAHVGGVKCEDKCKEMGKEWKKQEEKRQKSHSAAVRKRKDLVETASRLQKEIEDRVATLETAVDASELKVENLQAELDEIRARDRGKASKGKKKGKVNALSGLAKSRVEGLRTALIEFRHQHEKDLGRLAELEDILSKFKEEYNPNFNDEGVKRAVRSWEEYAAIHDGDDATAAVSANTELDELCREDNEESGINWTQWENEEDGEKEISLIYKIAAYLPPSLANYIEDKAGDLKNWLIAGGILADNSDDSVESQAVKDARGRLSAEESSMEDLRSELKDHKASLNIDFGKDSIFRGLKGSCVSKESGEYTYELCWMEKAKQKPKKSGGSTNMGSFKQISSVPVDELTSSGQIVQREKVALQYQNGQTCWNGPARSTTVILECGETDEILKIAEDEKCVYSMYVVTPAVCEPPTNEKPDAGRKDEL